MYFEIRSNIYKTIYFFENIFPPMWYGGRSDHLLTRNHQNKLSVNKTGMHSHRASRFVECMPGARSSVWLVRKKNVFQSGYRFLFCFNSFLYLRQMHVFVNVRLALYLLCQISPGSLVTVS